MSASSGKVEGTKLIATADVVPTLQTISFACSAAGKSITSDVLDQVIEKVAAMVTENATQAARIAGLEAALRQISEERRPATSSHCFNAGANHCADIARAALEGSKPE